VTGLAQALNAPDSSLHWNVTPLWLSVKADVAFVWLVGFAGVLVIDGAGHRTGGPDPGTPSGSVRTGLELNDQVRVGIE
jgi:hypothetical protein